MKMKEILTGLINVSVTLLDEELGNFDVTDATCLEQGRTAVGDAADDNKELGT